MISRKMCYLVPIVLFGIVRGSHHDTSRQTQVGNCERLQEEGYTLKDHSILAVKYIKSTQKMQQIKMFLKNCETCSLQLWTKSNLLSRKCNCHRAK